jgi:hypothetical protein
VTVELFRDRAAIKQLHNALVQHGGARIEDGGDPFISGGAEDREKKIDKRQADGGL